MRGLSDLGIALLSVVCFLLAYLVLTNQTPYCHTLRQFRDGRVDYREFATNEKAFAYEKAQGFWEDRSGVVNEESGCASDKVYGWEGALAGAFLLAGFSGPIARVRAKGPSAIGGAMAKTILGIVTLGSLMSLVGTGAYIAPLLIPFHWFVARTATPWMRGVWIFFAGVCAWVLGSMGAYALFAGDDLAAFIFPGIVSGVFSVSIIATTSETFQVDVDHRSGGRCP